MQILLIFLNILQMGIQFTSLYLVSQYCWPLFQITGYCVMVLVVRFEKSCRLKSQRQLSYSDFKVLLAKLHNGFYLCALYGNLKVSDIM